MDKLPKELTDKIKDFTGATQPKKKYSENLQSWALSNINSKRSFIDLLKNESNLVLTSPLTKKLTVANLNKINAYLSKRVSSSGRVRVDGEEERKKFIAGIKKAGFNGTFKTFQQDPQNRDLETFIVRTADKDFSGNMDKRALETVGGPSRRNQMTTKEKKAMVNDLINKPKGSLKNTNVFKSAKSVAKSAKPVAKSAKPVAKSAKPVAKPAKPKPPPRPKLKAVPKAPPKPKPMKTKPKPSKVSMSKSVGGATKGVAKKPLKKGYKAKPTCWTGKATDKNGKRKKICV